MVNATEVVEFNAVNSEQKTPTYIFNLRRKLELKCNKRMSSIGFLPVADMDVADMVCGRYGHFCGRYEIFVADMVVADMVCGRYRRNSLLSGYRALPRFCIVIVSSTFVEFAKICIIQPESCD